MGAAAAAPPFIHSWDWSGVLQTANTLSASSFVSDV